MTYAEYMQAWVLRVVIFTAIGAPAQNAAPPQTNVPCKSSSGSVVGVITGGEAAKKLCRFGICLPPKAIKTEQKTCAPGPQPESKPAPPAAAPKELCPPNTSRIEGQPYCVTPDGKKLVDVIRIPATSSVPAPVNSSQAPVAR